VVEDIAARKIKKTTPTKKVKSGYRKTITIPKRTVEVWVCIDCEMSGDVEY
jgi:hypothetical protein